MPLSSSPPAVRPPLQARSRRTLERILRATERLLRKRRFEEIGVQEIVRSARTSVGVFYARFEDKSALLGALYTSYAAGIDAHVAAWRATQGPPQPGLFGAAAWVARYLIDSFGRNRNLLRALALHVRLHPDEVDPQASSERAAQHRFLEEVLLTQRALIRAADPERAVRMAIFLAASACRERILFADSTHARTLERSEATFAADLTCLIAGYLLCPAIEGST